MAEVLDSMSTENMISISNFKKLRYRMAIIFIHALFPLGKAEATAPHLLQP